MAADGHLGTAQRTNLKIAILYLERLWNSRHPGMTALSRVTLASAGLSCYRFVLSYNQLKRRKLRLFDYDNVDIIATLLIF